ncbi:hypothetical protein H2200_010862 [Cladophialophora chaetospira]|uniref:Uncharacterized protein n=1 Tax=Cladophialophora chaetospira TaxID=386627 RepID=A0AA39CDX9_9EURO|nr:hypothetical protein H2200_010862 [Cladophialophora chaetospira]
MATSGPHGHDPNTCPEEIKKNNAETKAGQILAQIEATDKRHRGRTNYVHLGLDDLPASAEILSDLPCCRSSQGRLCWRQGGSEQRLLAQATASVLPRMFRKKRKKRVPISRRSSRRPRCASVPAWRS